MMFNNLTYKQKFYAIIGGFIVLSLASYKKTYRQVFSAKQELNSIEKKLMLANNSDSEIYNLKNDISILDNIIGGHTSDPMQAQRLILDFVTKNGSEVNLVSMEDVHLHSNEEFLIYTNQLELEGSYEELMRLAFAVEKDFNSSRVVSNTMFSKKNYRTNRTKLYLRIIFQNYEKV